LGEAVADRDVDLIQGTLNVLILKTLSWKPMNGYAIAQWVRDATAGAIELDEGALYPALHRMEHRGWIAAEWALTENNRRAKYYHLTPLGRRTLRSRTESWERLVTAVGKVLYAPPNRRPA
jgi:PadR family transcriptional regulator PadR